MDHTSRPVSQAWPLEDYMSSGMGPPKYVTWVAILRSIWSRTVMANALPQRIRLHTSRSGRVRLRHNSAQRAALHVRRSAPSLSARADTKCVVCASTTRGLREIGTPCSSPRQ
jgi:hypothetical protein